MGTIDASKYDIQKDRAFLLLAQIDGPLLKTQRAMLGGIIDMVKDRDGDDPELDDEQMEALAGIENLLDVIADFCHDELGMDTIIEDTDNIDYRGDEAP